MYSKEQQLKTKKIKVEKIPFGMRKSRGTFGTTKKAINKRSKKNLASTEDRKYLQWSKEQYFECIVCGAEATDRHHVKEFSSDKKNHKQLLPLCREHHTGNKLSPHGTPRLWRKHYPIESQREMADEFYENYLGEI